MSLRNSPQGRRRVTAEGCGAVTCDPYRGKGRRTAAAPFPKSERGRRRVAAFSEGVNRHLASSVTPSPFAPPLTSGSSTGTAPLRSCAISASTAAAARSSVSDHSAASMTSMPGVIVVVECMIFPLLRLCSSCDGRVNAQLKATRTASVPTIATARTVALIAATMTRARPCTHRTPMPGPTMGHSPTRALAQTGDRTGGTKGCAARAHPCAHATITDSIMVAARHARDCPRGRPPQGAMPHPHAYPPHGSFPRIATSWALRQLDASPATK